MWRTRARCVKVAVIVIMLDFRTLPKIGRVITSLAFLKFRSHIIHKRHGFNTENQHTQRKAENGTNKQDEKCLNRT